MPKDFKEDLKEALNAEGGQPGLADEEERELRMHHGIPTGPDAPTGGMTSCTDIQAIELRVLRALKSGGYLDGNSSRN